MKATTLALAVGMAAAVAVMGCGDDTETGGTGGSGNTGNTSTSATGEASATGPASASATTGSGGGSGGMGGSTGNGGMGGGMGGSGNGAFGDMCTGNGDCMAPYICFKFGMGGMLCTKECQTDADCAPESDQCNGMGVCKAN